jgi:DNA mismatch repair protein MutS
MQRAAGDPPSTDLNRSADPLSGADGVTKITPMISQYIEIKSVNPDCLLFYRMGDFYELFFADAEVASRALGIVLTKRGKHMGRDIPMCGVPVHRADEYLSRLIGLGHRVAVCEQIEDPAEAKKRGSQSLVKRDVVRLVTPGTITEDSLLQPSRANCLVAVTRLRHSETGAVYGLASVDISTGAFSVTEVTEAAFGAEIARIEAAEAVAPEALCADVAFARLFGEMNIPLTPVGRDAADLSERRLLDYFGLATLDGLGTLSRAEIAAAALAIFYIEHTQRGARPALNLPARLRSDAHMEIDAATRANLELIRTLTGSREGSLLAAIDFTVTPGGGRLLAQRIASPVTDAEELARRLDTVSFLRDNRVLREYLRDRLKATPDFARALSRLALQRSGPRDLAALRDGLLGAAAVATRLTAIGYLPADLATAAKEAGGVDSAIAPALADALVEDLPLKSRDGNFVRTGYDALLDETRGLRDESRRVIAELQTRYCELAQSRQLKLKHNNFLGFFIEVPQAQGEKLLKPPFDATFVHRQTMADAMRFSTAELTGLEAKLASAADSALARECEIFDQLARQILSAESSIKAASEGLAAIDVSTALAELADARGWTRPEIDASLAFVVEAGRHPVVEAALASAGKPFVANNCDLSGNEAGRIAIVTGPNMAGKSTYLRQNALIAVLAQIGSFVPAAYCKIGIVDRLFSRVGAADDLARGRSTFMVEMVETAAILNQATERSLVILDEIGRGTATFDGLAIAWAVMEHLHEKNGARTLFATHFHELTHLAKHLHRIVNLTIRVADWKGDLVFLHEIVNGAADKSYGIQVAKLAGLPTAVVGRAQALLAEFEAKDRQKPVERLVTDLPLFASANSTPEPPRVSKLGVALDAIDPNELTPREALEALYRLKTMRAEKS